jgi:hypothetical protein
LLYKTSNEKFNLLLYLSFYIFVSSTSANLVFDDRSRKRRSLIFAIFADNSSSQFKSLATVTYSLILTNEQRSLRSLIQDTKDFIDFIEYFEFCERFEHLETIVLIVTNDFLFIVTLLMIVIGWPSGWTKPDVGAPTQPIGGVGHPTLFNGLGWIDEPVRRSNPTHSRGAHSLFEKKEGVK